MKFNWALLFILLISILNFKCGGSDPTKQERVTKLLTQGGGKWLPSASSNAITLEGIDVEDELFQGFSISFTKNQFTVTGESPVWTSPDNWSFKDKKAKVLIRASDDREITIVSITSKELVIQMEWDQTTYGGRTKSLPGVYQFILNK